MQLLLYATSNNHVINISSELSSIMQLLYATVINQVINMQLLSIVINMQHYDIENENATDI